MKLERIISIIMLLLQKRSITAKELAHMFEVSVRTIYRDIDSINMAGIPIAATPGAGGGISIMETYKVDKGIFTAEDLIHILKGTYALENLANDKELAATIAKVKSFIPPARQEEIQQQAHTVSFNFSVVDDTALQAALRTLQDAIHAQQTVCFCYWSNQQETLRSVEPYQLVFRHGYWYLHAYCLRRQAFRLFKLSRLWQLSVTDERFLPRKAPSAFADYDAYMRSQKIEVELEADSAILDKVLDHCDHASVRPVIDEPDKYRVTFPFIPQDYDYGVLLSFGPHCRCVKPAFVREELQKRALAIAAHYEA